MTKAKQRSIPGSDWNKQIDTQEASRAANEYLTTLDDAAFGAASSASLRSSSRRPIQLPSGRARCEDGRSAYRELDDALGLTTMAGATLADTRSGKNGRHALVGLLRQSVFLRLAGSEDVNDAERLHHDPAMRWIVGGKAAQGRAASPIVRRAKLVTRVSCAYAGHVLRGGSKHLGATVIGTGWGLPLGGRYMTRRFSIALAFLATSMATALAETYPSRPITIVVPYPAGGPTDTLARILTDHMSTCSANQSS